MRHDSTYRLHIIPDGDELGFACLEEAPKETIRTVEIKESMLTQLTLLRRENVQFILRSILNDN